MKKVGWIGTGIMGLSMATHLRNAGHEVTIYSRTKEKAASLLALGAQWASSPKEVAEQSDIVFSIVGYPQDVEEVTLGEQGILQGLKAGGIVCDMTTSCPDLAQRIAIAAKDKGCFAVDAPVTGGDVGAKNATLSIFVGTEQQTLQTLMPCLEKMGKTIIHCGPAGMGQKAKLANQIAVAGATISVCESLLFARECGLDLEQWRQAAALGAGGSIAMTTLGKRLVDKDLSPGFFIEHFCKDLALCLEECRRMNIALPGLALAEQTYRILKNQGYGKQGTQALIQGLAQLSSKSWI